MDSDRSSEFQWYLFDTDDDFIGIFYRSRFWFGSDDGSISYFYFGVSRSCLEIDDFSGGTIIISFARIVFYKEDLSSDFEIQYFWSKHGLLDRFNKFLISRSRSYIGLFISCQLFKFFIIDPIDIDIMSIEFDRVRMGDLLIHSRPEESNTLIAGLSFSEFVEDDSKITLVLSMLSMEITDCKIEFFPGFGCEGEFFVRVTILARYDGRKLKKIAYKDDLQSSEGTTISPDHLHYSIDHIEGRRTDHRYLIEDEDFGFGDIFVEMFFLLDQFHVVVSQAIFDTDTSS